MRGAFDATYIRSAVKLKLSTRAREMYACGHMQPGQEEQAPSQQSAGAHQRCGSTMQMHNCLKSRLCGHKHMPL
jgi:hypothetical protein